MRGKRKQTPTHLARSGQALQGQEKRKTEADGNGPRPAERGEDGSAKTNLPKRNLSLPGNTQGPNLPIGKETAREIGNQWGLVDGTRETKTVQGIQFIT